jgi:flagellar motor switch/type III secretory pathway protein FliN
MTPPTLSWLPPPAEGDVERAIGLFLADWARTWFVAPVRLRAVKFPGRNDNSLRWYGNHGSRVGVMSPCRLNLGAALVDHQADLDHLQDQAILLGLADAAAEDLAARLAPLQPQADNSKVSMFRLADDSPAWSLVLCLSEQIQIALRRASARHKRPPQLAPLSEALAPERVRIGCRIGSAQISAGELAELSKGDLITFDHRTTDSLQLTIADQPCSKGKARIVGEGPDVAVKIVESLDLR